MSDSTNVDPLTNTAATQLVTIVERLERLAEEKAGVMEDIKEVFSEAKGNGFDVATLRRALRIRAMDPGKRAEQEAILDLYMAALGGR